MSISLNRLRKKVRRSGRRRFRAPMTFRIGEKRERLLYTALQVGLRDRWGSDALTQSPKV